jgi:hypothetical protein
MDFKITSSPKGKKTQFVCTADGVEIGKRCSYRDYVKCVVMSKNDTGKLFVLSWHSSADAKTEAHKYTHAFTLIAEVLAATGTDELDTVEIPSATFNRPAHRLQRSLGLALLPCN